MNPPPQTRVRYQPHLALRLACWFGIYFSVAYFDIWGYAIRASPDSHLWLYWFSAYNLPSGIGLLICNTIGHPTTDSSDYVISKEMGNAPYIFADGCFLLNLVLSLIVRGKRMFWSLIVLLILLIVLSFYGSSCYIRIVF